MSNPKTIFGESIDDLKRLFIKTLTIGFALAIVFLFSFPVLGYFIKRDIKTFQLDDWISADFIFYTIPKTINEKIEWIENERAIQYRNEWERLNKNTSQYFQKLDSLKPCKK